MPALSFGMIKDIGVVAPNSSEQNDFVEFVKQIDKSKSAIQKSLDETQILFDSLMQKYFG
jgi:type I restriction enzyme S subunit